MNVCIAPGTKIGDGAIIGMGAVVSGEVPPLSIVGNQKWRIIGYRDKEEYDKLDKNRKYG
jgi:maltose O-acetyltransferase